jgi:hypothetical protein
MGPASLFRPLFLIRQEFVISKADCADTDPLDCD